MSNVLEVRNISKSYSQVKALDNFSYTFSPGIYGLTGKNGAGKTTLMQILTGYLRCDNGEILWNGAVMVPQSKGYKALLGYMPQQQTVYNTMSCLQFMNYMASLKGIGRKNRKNHVEDLLRQVHLWEKRFELVNALSGGMKQRLLFAQACLGNPHILILDEPTAGVDPDERQQIIVKNCEGKIVIMSTHIISDITNIAKDEIHLDKGRISIDAK